MNRDLVLTALDVLAASIYGRQADFRDINRIRRESPAEQDLPIDVLSSRIIERELLNAGRRGSSRVTGIL